MPLTSFLAVVKAGRPLDPSRSRKKFEKDVSSEGHNREVVSRRVISSI